jgi:hypothetical protein
VAEQSQSKETPQDEVRLWKSESTSAMPHPSYIKALSILIAWQASLLHAQESPRASHTCCDFAHPT